MGAAGEDRGYTIYFEDESAWSELFSNDPARARAYIETRLPKGQKLYTVWDGMADKRPDVITELIKSYGMSHCFTAHHHAYKYGPGRSKFNKESPVKHKEVIQEIFKFLSPAGKRKYQGELDYQAAHQRECASGEPDFFGWRARRPPVDPATAHLQYKMTNVATLTKQQPANLMSEVRERGRSRTVRNELQAATWADPMTVAAREGVNLSAYGKGGRRGRTRKTRRARATRKMRR